MSEPSPSVIESVLSELVDVGGEVSASASPSLSLVVSPVDPSAESLFEADWSSVDDVGVLSDTVFESSADAEVCVSPVGDDVASAVSLLPVLSSVAEDCSFEPGLVEFAPPAEPVVEPVELTLRLDAVVSLSVPFTVWSVAVLVPDRDVATGVD
ncbi:hypothetical protein ACFR9U_19145 [Halorientalis brevis]|uniref:Halobacterial output domain-containing protein n=1 Tax=Halorientalis brevis TaxID=1126241 RepID=A0ABD6CGN5_9EURY|nr:hypothetical protein [Halorientalis brevis]